MINIFSNIISFGKEKAYIIVIIVLAVFLVLALSQWYVVSKNLQASNDTLKIYQHNEKVLDFTKLFITKVLKAQGEVPFEDRLQLENTVRDVNNKQILDQWQKFTDSKTEPDAQIEVKNLLELLVNKIAY